MQISLEPFVSQPTGVVASLNEEYLFESKYSSLPITWMHPSVGNACQLCIQLLVCFDITHVDCGPTRFAVWRRMQRQDTESVIQQLESVFFERGAPVEILTDNDPAFRSGAFMQFAERWALRVRFRCAYVASGSGIAERCHRSVKRIARGSVVQLRKQFTGTMWRRTMM